MLKQIEPRLPFPTKPITIKCVEMEEYIIPEDKKTEVLKQLYVFEPIPSLDEIRYDLHSGKTFAIRNFRVIRNDGWNMLVSPYYEQGGGTVIDWISPNAWKHDEF